MSDFKVTYFCDEIYLYLFSFFLPKYSVEGEATLAERPHLKTFISLALCERATFPGQPSTDLPTQPSDGGLQRMTFESANARVVEMSSSQIKQVHNWARIDSFID